jgi:hypothetical protein
MRWKEIGCRFFIKTPIYTNKNGLTEIEESIQIIKMPAEENNDKLWGTVNYVGSTTQAAACCGFLCFCIPGCLILLCPMVRTTTIRIKCLEACPPQRSDSCVFG